MSHCAYNGIVLSVVETNLFGRQAVTSQDTGDYLYTKFTLDLNCVYSPGATSFAFDAGVPVVTPGVLPADTDLAIRHALMEKRRTLIFADEAGNTILSSPLGGTDRDCVGGPHPISCDVRRIRGSKTWIVNFRVETYLDVCPGQSEPDALISNRWSQHHQIDDNQMTRIVTQGIAHFRLDSLSLLPHDTADQFRSGCLPSIPLGFKRSRVEIALSSLNNVLTYTVVDEQQYYSLGDLDSSPHPDVLKFEGQYMQSTTTGQEGLPSPFLVAGCSIRVFGRPRALRANLYRFAVFMISRKLNLGAAVKDPFQNGQVLEIAALESLHAPVVELNAKVKLAAAKNPINGLMALRQEFLTGDGAVAYQVDNPNFRNDGTCPQLPNDGNTRGDYTGALFVTELQAACSQVVPPPPPPGPYSGGFTRASPAYSVSVTINQTGDLETTETNLADSNTDTATYSEYKIDSRWIKKYHRIAAPLAGPVGKQSQLQYDGNGGFTETGGPNQSRPQVEIMTVALPTSERHIIWTAERVGAMPALPQPVISDKNFVLLDTDLVTAAPELMPDQQVYIFRCSGMFRYAVRDSRGAGDDIPLCVVPWTTGNFDDPGASIVGADFTTGIIESENASGAPTGTPVGADT